MKEIRALVTISPDLLATNKLDLNQTCETVGSRAAPGTAPQWHALCSRRWPGCGAFARISQQSGVRVALNLRVDAFREAGL